MSYKPLFSRALGADPRRLHFAAHSHHLWPDASFDGQVRAWAEANRHADRKWDLIFGEVVPEAQDHVARELKLPSARHGGVRPQHPRLAGPHRLGGGEEAGPHPVH